MKRIVLFLATNLAIMLVLSVVVHLLGLNRFMTGSGLNLPMLLGFSAVLGFGGAFISLMMSKTIAKWSTGARVIEYASTPGESWLLETVARQAQQAGIKMPEVAIYDSPDVNAFATGPSKNNSLVAVSTGLLAQMNRDEAEAVLGHEVAHVANGDMVTLTLIQGVVNTFVIAIARVVGYVVDKHVLKNEDENGHGIGYFVTVIVMEITLGILASMIVAWFSRQREYRADRGGAQLAGRDKMIAALWRLKQMHEPSHLPSSFQAHGINGGGKSSFMALFSTHPPLDERIARLQQ